MDRPTERSEEDEAEKKKKKRRDIVAAILKDGKALLLLLLMSFLSTFSWWDTSKSDVFCLPYFLHLFPSLAMVLICLARMVCRTRTRYARLLSLF